MSSCSEPESRCTAKLRSSSGPSRSSRLRVPHASKAKLEGHVDTRGRQYPNSCGGLALRLSHYWSLRSATDAIPLPKAKPRTMRKHFVVPSIGCRDVACAEWPNIRRCEHFL